MKSLLKAKFPEIDSLLYQWLLVAQFAEVPINRHTLYAKALNICDRITPYLCDPCSCKSLESVRETPAWVTRLVRRTGLRSVNLHGKEAAVKISDVAGGIGEPRAVLDTFKPECIFNMDDTGLFLKLFPRRSNFMLGENKRLLRGTKELGANNRVGALVCTNATGSSKVLIALIGKSANPSRFRAGQPAVRDFIQHNAWAASVTFKMVYDGVLAVY